MVMTNLWRGGVPVRGQDIGATRSLRLIHLGVLEMKRHGVYLESTPKIRHRREENRKLPKMTIETRKNGGGTGGYERVICSDQQAKFLEQMLDATVYPRSECPSCGDEYKNLFNRHHSPTWKFFFNSNAYSYNMVDNFIGTPPPIDGAPGYAYSRMYANYPH